MMKLANKTLSVLALAGVLLCGVSAVQAAPANAAPNNGYDLTPEQSAAMRKIFTENYDNMSSTREALAAKRAELDAQLASPNPDGAKIESLSREIGELRGKMLAARADVRAKLNREGLPSDYYGPDAPRYHNGYDREIRRGGPAWGHHGHGHGGRGRGCGGCW